MVRVLTSPISISGSLEFGLYFLMYEELKQAKLGYATFSPYFKEDSYIPSKYLSKDWNYQLQYLVNGYFM